MGEPAPKYRPGRPLAVKIGAAGAVYLALLFAGVPFQRLVNRLHAWWWTLSFADTTSHRVLDRFGHGFMVFFPAALVSVFFAAIALGPLALLARTIARSGLREGKNDLLEPTRRWASDHPAWVKAITGAVGALWAIRTEADGLANWGGRDALGEEWIGIVGAFGVVGVPMALALIALLRSAVRAFLAPITSEAAPQVASVAHDEITFDAVAVTAETYAAIVAMMALNGVALVLALTSNRLFGDPRVMMGLVGYMGVALGGAAIFRRASKVAIGVDGVLVKGTSRTRFFAYRDLDGARAPGADLELVRKGSVVLRLQLHGEDAAKRDAVRARIIDAIVRVKEGRHAVPAQIVSGATAEQLARAAAGVSDYRGAALTREQLWALVEGPEVEAGARQAAALALARTSGGEDRARLRVAAEHCAAPEVRVALERLAEEEANESERSGEMDLARRSA